VKKHSIFQALGTVFIHDQIIEVRYQDIATPIDDNPIGAAGGIGTLPSGQKIPI
jgi:hypothetical protein